MGDVMPVRQALATKLVLRPRRRSRHRANSMSCVSPTQLIFGTAAAAFTMTAYIGYAQGQADASPQENALGIA
jgi:hypothetical protein